MLPSSSQEGRAGERRAMMTYDMLTFFFFKKKKKRKKDESEPSWEQGETASRRAGKQTGKDSKSSEPEDVCWWKVERGRSILEVYVPVGNQQDPQLQS
jgi:hypothetical protein